MKKHNESKPYSRSDDESNESAFEDESEDDSMADSDSDPSTTKGTTGANGEESTSTIREKISKKESRDVF